MTISLRFLDGEQRGQVLEFDRPVGSVRIGRDPHVCQVLFPRDCVAVGREHCALTPQSGRWRLDVPDSHRVTIDGFEADAGTVLPAVCVLQLGPDGPRLEFKSRSSPDLPGTAPQGSRPGIQTRLRASERASHYSRRIALGSVLLAAILAAVAGRRLTLVETALQLTSTQLAALEADVREVTEPGQLPVAWSTILRQAEPSVYLLLERRRVGTAWVEKPLATAWVIDQPAGRLATCAHAAAEFENRPEDAQWVIRGTDPTRAESVIQAVELHPGYAAFTRLWEQHDPQMQTAEATFVAASSLPPACDVALLTVVAGSNLGPALTTASVEVLHQVQAGDAVAAIGFPAEGLPLAEVASQRPAAKYRIGYVAAVTDEFGQSPRHSSAGLMVQHALPASGGASGSPIFNVRGEVVAIHSAGNPIGTVDAGRVESGAALFVGQRVDLLQELWDGDISVAQAERLQRWQEEVSRLFTPRAEVDRQRILALVERWTKRFPDGAMYSARLEREAIAVDSGSQRGAAPATVLAWRLRPEADGECLVAVIHPDRQMRGKLAVRSMQSQQLIARSSTAPSWYATVAFPTQAGELYRLELDAPPAGSEWEVLARLTRENLSLQELREDQVRREWVQRLVREDALQTESEVVHQELHQLLAVASGRGAAKPVQVNLRRGRYLVVAAASDPQNVGLDVYGDSQADGILLADGWQRGSLAHTELTLERSMSVEIQLLAQQAGTIRLTVYRAWSGD